MQDERPKQDGVFLICRSLRRSSYRRNCRRKGIDLDS